MARVLVYERVVDAVLTETHGGTACDAEIQDGTKIKEESIDTAWDANTTEHYTLDRFNSIDYDKSFLSKNDISHKHIDNVGQINVERKDEKRNEEQVCDTFINTKRKYSNEISNNDHTGTSTTIIETSNRKRKLRSATSNSGKKAKRTTKKSSVCNICFRHFANVQHCMMHQRYYKNNEVYECNICSSIYASRAKLSLHIISHQSKHKSKLHRRYLTCNFCNCKYREENKNCLQSHLFHMHGELIYSSNVTKSKNSELINVSYGNSDESKEPNTTLTNKVCTRPKKDDVMKTDRVLIEKPFNNEESSIKKLRQPTLTEYLEFCKRKHDIKTSPNKSDMKNDFISAFNCNKETQEDLIPKTPEKIMRSEANSLSKNLNNFPKRMAHSTLDQSEEMQNEICLSKKPFVRLHADVEMMKSFLENLPDTKNEIIENKTNDVVSRDRELPYSLRSSKMISFIEKNLNLRSRKNRNVSNESRHNSRSSIKKIERTVTYSSKYSRGLYSRLQKILAPFKYKYCTIPLTRCDDNLRNLQSVSTITTTFQQNDSYTAECNPIPFQENNTKNNAVKKLEVSLERLANTTTSNVNDTKPKETILDVEKENNKCFSCKVCKKIFSSKLAKRAHIKASHIAYMSSICEARYTLKHELLRHYVREHLDKRDQCCICYNVFPDYITLKRHLVVHCLKYIQKEDDQFPLDIEMKCNSTRQDHKCSHCNKVFSSQSTLMEHQNFCSMKKGIQENQENCIKETSTFPKIIFKMHYNKDVEKISVTPDKKIRHDDIRESNDEPDKKTSEIPTSSINEDKTEINNDTENSSANNQNFIETESDIVSEKQDPKNLSANDDSMISDIVSKNKIYPCSLCGKRFQNRKNLDHHVRTFSKSTNACPMCNTAFSSMRLLRTHITAAHVPQFSNNYNLHCMFCNQGFIKKYELRSHVLHLHARQMLEALAPNILRNQEKSDESDKHTATCNVCNLVFETVERYMEHKMYYYKNHKFTCSLCAQDFQGMYMYHHHTKLTHYSEDKRKSYSFTCDICNEGFNHELHFYSHNMHVHLNRENLPERIEETEEKSHVSALQKKVENSSMNEQREIEQSSNEYVCQICHLKCANFDDMEEHKALYSNDGDFKCGICNRRCKTLALLEQHKRLTHICRDVYYGHLCYICGEIVATITSLKCHEKHFHFNAAHDNVDDCECKKCNQRFSSTIAYKEHQCKSTNDTHNIDKDKYDCSFCSMKFSSANEVQIHIIHSHFKDVLTKTDLKSKVPDIDKKQSAQQLVKASSSSDNQGSSVQQSDEISKQYAKEETIEKKNKDTESTIASLNQVKNVFSRVEKPLLTEKTPTPAISTPINEIDFEDNISTSVITKNSENNTKASIAASVESTNGLLIDLQKTRIIPFYLTGSVNSPKANLITTKIKSTGSAEKSESISANSTSIESIKSKMIPILPKSPVQRIEIINRPKLMNDCIGYACPLCSLEYPSLMFFHAHLKYFHADLIRTSNGMQKLNQSAQKTPIIECLLCPCTFIEEAMYKKHLKNLHTRYTHVPNLNTMKNANNMNNPVTAQMSNNNTKHNTGNTSPELIIVDDDESNNVEDSSAKHALANTITTLRTSSGGNENVGKLKVKSFAKIIESLNTNHALKNCNPSQSVSIQSNIPKPNSTEVSGNVSYILQNIYK